MLFMMGPCPKCLGYGLQAYLHLTIHLTIYLGHLAIWRQILTPNSFGYNGREVITKYVHVLGLGLNCLANIFRHIY